MKSLLEIKSIINQVMDESDMGLMLYYGGNKLEDSVYFEPLNTLNFLKHMIIGLSTL